MRSFENLTSLLPASPAAWNQAVFILASCLVVSITVAPAAERKLLLNYGPRRAHAAVAAGDASQRQRNRGEQRGGEEYAVLMAVRKLTSLGQIPHSWFFTYYAVYLACAYLWAVQYYQQGDNQLRSLARWQVQATTGSPTMAGGQVVIVWCMMLLQAGRRLYECFAVMKPSRSTMWFIHWVMGLGFYLGVSVAIWIEGSGTSHRPKASASNAFTNSARAAAAILQNQLQVTSLTADAKLKVAVALPLFLFGWFMQHRCHKHLASLVKYSLPDLGLFRHLVCPHYSCECLIYLSLAVVAAPEGHWCNRTVLSVLMFVAVNLGVTAHGTRNWYLEKFGPDKVLDKWIMIPWLY